VAEQAIAELRALKRAGAKVTLDAGARQVVRMTLARPLADDPVLLGRQPKPVPIRSLGIRADAPSSHPQRPRWTARGPERATARAPG
jgi:hypothetical protein